MFKKFVFGICVPSAEIGSASAYAISNFWRAEYRKDQVQGIWFGRTSDSSPCVEGLLCQGPTFVFILLFCFSSWLLHNVFFSCGCDVWRSQHFSILYFFSSFLKLTSTGSCASPLAINFFSWYHYQRTLEYVGCYFWSHLQHLLCITKFSSSWSVELSA